MNARASQVKRSQVSREFHNPRQLQIGDVGAILVGLTPAGIIALVFVFLPVGFSLLLTFSDWSLLRPNVSFIGLDNWRRLLLDPEFWNALRISICYVLGSVLTTTVIALSLAIVLDRPLRGSIFFRLAFFLPVVLSNVVASLFWEWALQPQTGLVNRVLRVFELPGPGWLADPQWALGALIMIHAWRFAGYYMLIFLVGLQAIPPIYHEAALLDGAGAWHRFLHITWPLLRPTAVLVLVSGTIFAFQVFGPVFVLTGGGPARSTTTLSFYLYDRAIGRADFGYGATVGWAQFIALFPFAWWQFRRGSQT